MPKKLLPLVIIVFTLCLAPMLAQAANGPYLRFSTQANYVTVNWEPVDGASSYKIEYGKSDVEGFEHTESLGDKREHGFYLDQDSRSVKVAVSAYDADGNLLAVSSLEKVELPQGSVQGYFFLEISGQYGTDSMAFQTSDAGIWVSIYDQLQDGAYKVYGVGDAQYIIHYNHPSGQCSYTLTQSGNSYVTGTMAPNSGKVTFTVKEVYESPVKADGSCFGMGVPDSENVPWEVSRDFANMPLKKGSMNVGPNYNMHKYEAAIYNLQLDGCPSCQ